MSGEFVFAISGLENADDIAELSPAIERIARMAINAGLDKGRTLASAAIREQVRFPASYLQGENSRLKVTQRATANRLEGVITGRRRATSLARFVTNQGKRGLTVQIKPGRAVTLERAFLMKLRSGQSGALGNMGLALRTKNGERPNSAYKPKSIGANLWLLYGPSVDQVFRTVKEDIREDVEGFLVREFQRLLDLEI